MEKRVYTSASTLRRPGAMLREIWGDFQRGQDLALRLTIRDIKALYRQSVLGIFWAFLLPLANTATWIFLNSSGIVSLGDQTAIPYPIYVFTGTMIWAILLESIQAPMNKVGQNKTVIAKVNFPREALVLSAIYQSLFNGCIKALILIVFLAVSGYLGGLTVLLFPLALLSLVLCGSTIGLLLTPISVLYSDVSKGLPLLMQFLMYTTPVIYAIPKTGITAALIVHNPLTPLITTSREWLTGTALSFGEAFAWVNAANVVLFACVLILFRIALPILTERMSA